MPTVYQLVPGSLIAKLWFNAVFPPPLKEETERIAGTSYTYFKISQDQTESAVFQNLMVVSASLAIGLLLGFGFVTASTFVLKKIFCSFSKYDPTDSFRGRLDRSKSRRNFDYTNADDDPDSDDELDDNFFIDPTMPINDIEDGNLEPVEPTDASPQIDLGSKLVGGIDDVAENVAARSSNKQE